MSAQNELLESLLGDFLDESDQLLSQLNQNLLQLDEWVRACGEDHHERCDAELLNEMFRAAHSLKGLSGMMGLNDINTLTHKIENVFDAARSNQLSINGDVVDLIFVGIDQLTALVELLKDPDGEPVDCNAVLEGIRELLRSAGAERKTTSQADAEKALAGALTETTPEIPDPFDGLTDAEDVSEAYLSLFLDETDTALDELSETLLALENGGNSQEVSRLLATSHKIKGSAASVGLNRAAKLAHLMEDSLQSLIEAGDALSGEVTDALLACTDALRQYVRQLRQGSREPDHLSEAGRRLLAAGARAPGSAPPAETGLAGRLDGVVADVRNRLAAADVESLSVETGIAPAAIEQARTSENVELAILRRLAAHCDKTERQRPHVGHVSNVPTTQRHVGNVPHDVRAPSDGRSRRIPLEALSDELNVGDDLLTMVVLTLQGEVGGNLVLFFDEPSGRQLAASLLGREVGTEPQWSDIEMSASTETGNILGCAYVNALSRLIGTDLAPSAPYFIQDFGASVLQQAVMSQAAISNSLLLCDIGFHREGKALDWRVVFVPTQGMQDAMRRSLHATP